jgi:hypothetical protein
LDWVQLLLGGECGRDAWSPPSLAFGGVFVAIGFYILVGRFLYKRFDRRRGVYLLTDRRALVIRQSGREITTTPVRSPSVIRRRRDGIHGTVV